MLDFVGNSERFNEGYVPPKEEPLDPELGGSHRRGGGTFVPTVVATDSWIWREWFDVAPGREAVDLEDLAGLLRDEAGSETARRAERRLRDELNCWKGRQRGY